MTWAGFLSSVRAYLRDDGDNKKFSDELIYFYTRDAIRDYSHWFPHVKRVTVQPTDGVYPLPMGTADIISVECPEGTFLSRRLTRPGRRYRDVNRPTHYWVDATGINVNSVDAQPIKLTYAGMHDVPEFNFSDEFETFDYAFTVPGKDMELLNLYVRAQCLGQTRSRQANLDRFKRTGRRDDNPMHLETQTLMDEYYAKVSERTQGKAIRLSGGS